LCLLHFLFLRWRERIEKSRPLSERIYSHLLTQGSNYPAYIALNLEVNVTKVMSVLEKMEAEGKVYIKEEANNAAHNVWAINQ